MALQKGSPLTTFLKAVIGEVTEKGQINQIITKYHGPTYEHFCQPIGTRSASLNTLMLLFIIVSSGKLNDFQKSSPFLYITGSFPFE